MPGAEFFLRPGGILLSALTLFCVVSGTNEPSCSCSVFKNVKDGQVFAPTDRHKLCMTEDYVGDEPAYCSYAKDKMKDGRPCIVDALQGISCNPCGDGYICADTELDETHSPACYFKGILAARAEGIYTPQNCQEMAKYEKYIRDACSVHEQNDVGDPMKFVVDIRGKLTLAGQLYEMCMYNLNCGDNSTPAPTWSENDQIIIDAGKIPKACSLGDGSNQAECEAAFGTWGTPAPAPPNICTKPGPIECTKPTAGKRANGLGADSGSDGEQCNFSTTPHTYTNCPSDCHFSGYLPIDPSRITPNPTTATTQPGAAPAPIQPATAPAPNQPATTPTSPTKPHPPTIPVNHEGTGGADPTGTKSEVVPDGSPIIASGTGDVDAPDGDVRPQTGGGASVLNMETSQFIGVMAGVLAAGILIGFMAQGWRMFCCCSKKEESVDSANYGIYDRVGNDMDASTGWSR